jgi:hypothetical protein
MNHLLLATSLLAGPICTEASHDRLIVQAGRDVCGAVLSAKGPPRAGGYLPTVCSDPGAVYRVDAARMADLCVLPDAHRA